MADTDPDVSAAARALIAHRWGSTKVDRLVAELVARRDDLTLDHLRLLGVEAASRGASVEHPHLDEGDIS